MPIYEYRCAACGHELEALQKVSDSPLEECPSCQKRKLERLISAPSFRLKGGGWYETDFKSDKEKKRNLVESADAKPKDGAEAKSNGKDAKDAKPKEAAKDAAKPAKESKPKRKSTESAASS
jgi:putative FmdB family regulatory protein